MNRLPIIRQGKSLAVDEDLGKYNARLKLCPNSCGDWIPSEEMIATRHIFNPDGLEYAFGKVPNNCTNYIPDVDYSEIENKNRAVRRAKAKLYDLLRCNLDMSYFLTLTISPEAIPNRDDYTVVIKKLNQWLNNRVKRKSLKYCGVVERHKNGGLHFHFVVNDSLDFVDSGTVKCVGRKKPIKVATADRYKIPTENRKTVYNLPEWKYGFTSAIEITDDDLHLKTAHYLVKYLTKDFEKIGGRYYYSGGDLQKPKYVYFNCSYNDTDESYSFTAGGTDFKVKKYE